MAANQVSGQAGRCWSDVVGRDSGAKHTDLGQTPRFLPEPVFVGTELVGETTLLCRDPQERTLNKVHGGNATGSQFKVVWTS